MTSVVYVAPTGRDVQVAFHLPLKCVLGRMLCDTDGSIGYPTLFGGDLAREVLEACEALQGLDERDKRRLRMMRLWIERGDTLFANWVH